MLTHKLYFNRDDLDDLLPTEGDDRHYYALSGYAIPRTLDAQHDASKRELRVTFEYPLRSVPVEFRPLDSDAPRVDVRVHPELPMVCEFRVASLDRADELPALAERFRRAANDCNHIALRLSYRLVATLLDVYYAKVTGAPVPVGAP